MLPVESLKFLSDQTKQANAQTRIVNVEAEPDDVYYVEQPDGKLERVTALRPHPKNHASDLETLVRVAASVNDPPAPTEIWYGRQGVCAVNPTYPAPFVTFALTPSPQLAALIQWDREGRKRLSQGELVILLRTLFAGCYPEPFLNAVRSVKTTKGAEINSQISQGKVSLSKAVVAEMTGAHAIPAEITFVVPVFAQASVRMQGPVRVAIDPDPQTEAFTLIVLPGDIESLFTEAEAGLHINLSALVGELGLPDGQDIPLYRGQP